MGSAREWEGLIRLEQGSLAGLAIDPYAGNRWRRAFSRSFEARNPGPLRDNASVLFLWARQAGR